LTKTLPDILTFILDIVIIGTNPGLMAAYKEHNNPGPGNHFWKYLFMSELSEVEVSHMDDHSLAGNVALYVPIWWTRGHQAAKIFPVKNFVKEYVF
jgi:TDG/mug DNA glycosylase family protein